jgi:predicted kinase
MKITVPKLSLVVLIGPSGSGKSTFARKHFLPTEVVSSDACRAMVSDDENNQAVTPEAFALLHYVTGQRLALGRLTVIDATNVQPEARAPLVALAREYHCLPVAVVMNLPENVCQERNSSRPDRSFGPHVIRNQRSQLRRSLRGLQREGFRHVFVLDSVEAVEAAVVERVPLWNDRTADPGPFDIIGDVHGCADELEQLLEKLGYGKIVIAGHEPGWSNVRYVHPEGRKVVFVGDLVDRGPRVLDTLSIARSMVTFGSALCVPGNHDMKLLKKLNGRDVQITHGLAETLAEIDALPDDVRPAFTKSLAGFFDGLVSHYVLDGGKLVVAHAGLKQEMQGRGSGKVRDFCLYGETNHIWHMDTLATVCRADPELLLATSYKVVDVTDPAGVAEGNHRPDGRVSTLCLNSVSDANSEGRDVSDSVPDKRHGRRRKSLAANTSVADQVIPAPPLDRSALSGNESHGEASPASPSAFSPSGCGSVRSSAGACCARKCTPGAPLFAPPPGTHVAAWLNAASVGSTPCRSANHSQTRRSGAEKVAPKSDPLIARLRRVNQRGVSAGRTIPQPSCLRPRCPRGVYHLRRPRYPCPAATGPGPGRSRNPGPTRPR